MLLNILIKKESVYLIGMYIMVMEHKIVFILMIKYFLFHYIDMTKGNFILVEKVDIILKLGMGKGNILILIFHLIQNKIKLLEMPNIYIYVKISYSL
jgi:hypothetical protein